MVADLPFGRQHDRGLAVAVADRVQFRVQAAPGASDTAEDASLAPPHEAVAEGLVGTVFGGRVTPDKAVSDHVDDARDDAAVVDPGARREPCWAAAAGCGRIGLRRAGIGGRTRCAPYLAA